MLPAILRWETGFGSGVGGGEKVCLPGRAAQGRQKENRYMGMCPPLHGPGNSQYFT